MLKKAIAIVLTMLALLTLWACAKTAKYDDEPALSFPNLSWDSVTWDNARWG